MEQVTQDPPKLRKIYDYLKNNNLVKAPTYEDWEQKMQDPRVAEKTYNYLRDNGKVKSKDFSEFQSTVGLKKKEPTSVDTTAPQDGSQISAPVLESGLTEDQEKERNLQALSQQPVAAQQPETTVNTPQQDLGFFGTLKSIWNDLKTAASTPADPNEKAPQPFINALERGANQAEQAEIVSPFHETDKQKIDRLAELQRENQQLPSSKEYQRFNESKTVGESLKALADNPVKIIAELTGESLSALLLHGYSRVGAGALMGGAIGSVVPGIGTVSGLGGGATVGLADTSLGLEYSGKFVESLQEQGVDVTDPKQLKSAFENEEIVSKARASALKKGIPIAIFDLISGGVAGKIASKPAKSLLGKIGQGAAEFGVQAALGGGGELAGQVTSGEEISPSAIIAEMAGELGTTPIEVSNALLTFNRKIKEKSNEATKASETPAPKVDTEVQPATQPEVQQPAIEDASTIRSDQEQAPQGGQVIEGSQNIGGQDIQLAAQQSQEGRQTPAETQQQAQGVKSIIELGKSLKKEAEDIKNKWFTKKGELKKAAPKEIIDRIKSIQEEYNALKKEYTPLLPVVGGRDNSSAISQQELENKDFERRANEGVSQDEIIEASIEDKIKFGSDLTNEEVFYANENFFKPEGYIFDAKGDLIKINDNATETGISTSPNVPTAPEAATEPAVERAEQKYKNGEIGDRFFDTRKKREVEVKEILPDGELWVEPTFKTPQDTYPGYRAKKEELEFVKSGRDIQVGRAKSSIADYKVKMEATKNKDIKKMYADAIKKSQDLIASLTGEVETQSTGGETGVTKPESNEKGRKREGRQKRLLTQQEPEAEAQASAPTESTPEKLETGKTTEITTKIEEKSPSEKISIGSDIYFDWQGVTKKGKIQEMLPDGRVKIKGSDGTIYRKSLKEVSQREAEIKKAAPKDAEKTVEYNSKRKKPIGIIGDPNSGFMFQTDLGKTISKFFQKQFTAKGFLPRSVFDRWISAKGEISKYESQIKFTTSDLKKAIQEEYGKQLTDAEVTDVNLALQGKQPQNPIPPKTKALVQEMRDQIDNLTMRFIDEGVVAGDMADTFTKNLGTYITRSYQKYDDPFWADFVPEEVKNKAMGFLRGKYPGHSNEEMEGLLNYLMYDSDAPMSVMKGGKLGSKDLSILKKRGDIAPEIRALMGEYGDPLLNYARSVTKMAGYIAKHHFLEDVKAQGMNKFLFEKPTGKYYVPIAAEGSKTMAPLNGLYTTEEIAEAFQEFNENDPVAEWLKYYMMINAYVKAGKTVFSVMTHARNFFGNIGFVVANAHWRVNKAGKAAQVAWANVYSNDKVIREKLQEYIQLGIVQDSAMGGQLKAYLDDIRKGGDFFQRINESRLKKVKNGILDVTQNLYQFEDDLYKIYAFENEKARYKKAYPDMTEDQLNEKAAEIVRNTYPTYSLVPRIVKSLRLNPFVGTFVSFPAEVIRTTWNTAAIAKEEMANPSTRSIGIQRMVGLMSAIILPTIASYYSRFALGMDGDDDEDLKKFVAPWQKTSEFLYLNREGTKYKIVDMGFSDPHSYLKRPVQALLNEQDLTKAGIKAAGEILDPFLSEEMLTARLIDVKRNEKETGDHVYNPDAPVGDRLRDIYDHLAAAGEPGTVRSIENIYKGYYGKTDKYGKKYDLQNEITALLTGQKQEIKDIDQALLFRAYEIKDRFDRAEKDYYRVSKSKAATPEEIADAERRFKAANTAIMKDAIDLYRSAIRLGVDPQDAKKIMYKTQNKDLKKAIRAEIKKPSK